MKLNLKKLYKLKSQYDGEIGRIEKQIKEYVEFEFQIFYQTSDGFVILHIEDYHNAPLDLCLNIIEVKGKLTYEDYLNECI